MTSPPYDPPPRDEGPRTTTLFAIAVAVILVMAGGAVAMVLLTGGDSDERTGGEPSERITLVPNPDPSPEPTVEPSPQQPTGTRGLNPCDLLTASEATRLGLGKGDKDQYVARTCTWDLSPRGDTVRVWIQDDIGLAVVSTAGSRSLRIGDHEAIQHPGPSTGLLDSCEVAIGVTGTSRVDVVANSRAGKRQACTNAMRAANLVEPKLP